MPNWNQETILTVFVALTGIALLVQAIILLSIYLSTRKAARLLKEDFDDLRDSLMPVLRSSREILERIGPHVEPVTADIARVTANIKTTSTNLADITQQLRAQTADVQVSAAEIIERLRRQADRIDGMLTAVLDAADRAGGFVQNAVGGPARQLAGALAALKAIVESLRASNPKARRTHAAGDKDMFV